MVDALRSEEVLMGRKGLPPCGGCSCLSLMFSAQYWTESLSDTSLSVNKWTHQLLAKW